MDKTLIEFKQLLTLEDRLAIFPLYHQLNPRITEPVFINRMIAMENEKQYRLLAMLYEGKVVGISGYWISHKLYCGKYLEPDNVVIDNLFRSRGLGEMLQLQLEKIALENGCMAMMLDAYMANERGHQFYEMHGYVKKGYHFVKVML
jgi:GNAT superfamily N-acetyltransferase